MERKTESGLGRIKDDTLIKTCRKSRQIGNKKLCIKLHKLSKDNNSQSDVKVTTYRQTDGQINMKVYKQIK